MAPAQSTAKADDLEGEREDERVRGAMIPVTSGRRWVRTISGSMSRSTYMLMALAPPAASVPPISVTMTRPRGGQPRSASTIVGTVVISSSSMIRGLVSAT